MAPYVNEYGVPVPMAQEVMLGRSYNRTPLYWLNSFNFKKVSHAKVLRRFKTGKCTFNRMKTYLLQWSCEYFLGLCELNDGCDSSQNPMFRRLFAGQFHHADEICRMSRRQNVSFPLFRSKTREKQVRKRAEPSPRGSLESLVKYSMC